MQITMCQKNFKISKQISVCWFWKVVILSGKNFYVHEKIAIFPSQHAQAQKMLKEINGKQFKPITSCFANV